MILAPSQPDEMIARHRAAGRSSRAAIRRPSPRARNVEPILSLGEMTYFQFRGRAFGVPPLPWKAGAAMNEAHVATIEAMQILKSDATDRDALAEYYEALSKLPRLLWKNCRPTGRIRRFLYAIGLHRNPFANASDGELLEYSDFFLSRRMKSGAPSPLVAATLGRRTS